MKAEWYLLAQDIPDPDNFTDDGKVKYWAKWLNTRTGDVRWSEQD